MSVQQTPPQQKVRILSDKSALALHAKKKLATQKKSYYGHQSKSAQYTETTRINFYLEHLKATQPYIPSDVKYLVADGYYSKDKFVNGVVEIKRHHIGKLRRDANMRYLYTGEQKQLGAKRKYGGKVNLKDYERLTFVKEVATKVFLYTAVVNHVTLKRNIRIAN